jgi:hypothetical protein
MAGDELEKVASVVSKIPNGNWAGLTNSVIETWGQARAVARLAVSSSVFRNLLQSTVAPENRRGVHLWNGNGRNRS